MEIEQATPEYQAELDSMSVEQLEQRVSQEEGAAPPPQGEATGQPQGEIQTQQAQKETPKEDGPPKWFQDYAENMKRELGSFRSLASLKDQLPKLVQQEAQRQLAALQQAQQNANLSPEDQQAQAQLQAQQKEWEKFVDTRSDARAKAQLEALAGDYLPLLNELKEQKQQERLQSSTFDLIKEIVPEGHKEAWEEVFEGVAKDIEAGKAGAIEKFDRLAANPSEIALEIIRLQRSKVQGQAQQVTQQRAQAGKQAAQSVKSTAVQAGGKKSITEMTQAELDAMPIAELEAAIPEAR